jgi:hypothetical protein
MRLRQLRACSVVLLLGVVALAQAGGRTSTAAAATKLPKFQGRGDAGHCRSHSLRFFALRRVAT